MLNDKYIKKICLGTAQLGMDYGISNRAGMVPAGEAFNILRYAGKEGIGMLDTASVYGISEDIIGAFIAEDEAVFRIISKMPPAGDNDRCGAEETLRRSLDRLKTRVLYGYLVHSIQDFLKDEEIWDELLELKNKGLVEKIGFSVYHPKDIEKLFDKKIPFDIIQFPYSVFDRRFEPYLSALRSRKIETYVRSVFLQGLAFLDPYSLPKKLKKARNHILRLNRMSYDSGISVNALCLNFILLNDLIDSVIVGVDSLSQLQKNVEDIAELDKMGNLRGLLDGISIDDEDVLLPYRWN